MKAEKIKELQENIELLQEMIDSPDVPQDEKDMHKESIDVFKKKLAGLKEPKPKREKKNLREKVRRANKEYEKEKEQTKHPKTPIAKEVDQDKKRQKIAERLELVRMNKDHYTIVNDADEAMYDFVKKKDGLWHVECADKTPKSFKNLNGAVSYVTKKLYRGELKKYMQDLKAKKAAAAKSSAEFREKHPTGQTTPTEDVKKAVKKAVDKIEDKAEDEKATNKDVIAIYHSFVSAVEQTKKHIDTLEAAKDALKEIKKAEKMIQERIKQLSGKKMAKGGKVDISKNKGVIWKRVSDFKFPYEISRWDYNSSSHVSSGVNKYPYELSNAKEKEIYSELGIKPYSIDTYSLIKKYAELKGENVYPDEKMSGGGGIGQSLEDYINALPKKSMILKDYPQTYEPLSEEFNNSVIDEVGKDAKQYEYDAELADQIDKSTTATIATIVRNVLMEEFETED